MSSQFAVNVQSKSSKKSKTKSGRQMSRGNMPKKIRAYMALKNELLEYSEISSDRANTLRNTVIELDILSNMNMKYLAGAIYISEMINIRISSIPGSSIGDVSPSDFDPSVSPMKDVLIRISVRDGSKTQSKKLLSKRLEVLFTYTQAIFGIMIKNSGPTETIPDSIPDDDVLPSGVAIINQDQLVEFNEDDDDDGGYDYDSDF
jgi:sporulation protein YlmC with PRC-barrel domain